MLLQIWKFIAPGLYKNERQAIYPFLLATPCGSHSGQHGLLHRYSSGVGFFPFL